MAKLKGPLFSLGAVGGVGGEILFRCRRGVAFASRLFFPGSKKSFVPSSSQLSQRELYRTTAAAWSALSWPEKKIYVDRALPLHLSGYALYMRENMVAAFPCFVGELELGSATLGSEV